MTAMGMGGYIYYEWLYSIPMSLIASFACFFYLVLYFNYSTHVASTTCGHTYGVSENCDLCAVKVLTTSGSGSLAGVIAGVEHVVGNCGGARCVVNMSLGGGKSAAVNAAVAAAFDKGVTVVVAAGNDNADACNYSPASEPKAITVGSTTDTDDRSSFSNKGSCVDVYAPGSSIKAAWIGSNIATNTISGTSMASPRKFEQVTLFDCRYMCCLANQYFSLALSY